MSASLWMPDGKSMVDANVWKLQIAAREYDARLVIGQSNDTGEWAVYIKLERGTLPEMNDLYPIYGLGHDTSAFPHPEDLQRKLWQMDLVRHGDENLDKMNRENERLRKQQAAAADEATGIAAEAYEWGHNRMSNEIGHRRPRVYIGEHSKHRRPEVK